MTKLFASALIAVSLLASGAATATTPAKDPIKQECHKANPKDHKAYLKCVSEKKAAQPAGNANAAQKAPSAPASAPATQSN
jgi:hypothetical protein